VDRDQLIQRLMATFLEELEEHVAALNRDLLALEKDLPAQERRERLRTLLRTAHSLKGAARSVNVSVLEQACHHLEEVLAAVRDDIRPLDGALSAFLFATADALEEAGMRLREQHDLADGPLAALLPQLEAVAHGESPPRADGSPRARRAEVAVAAPAPAPVIERPSPPPTPPARNEPVAEPAGSTPTVRVAADKLDTLLARSGELLVARRRVRARLQDLAAVREFVVRLRTEWRPADKALGRPRRAGAGLPAEARPGESAERDGVPLSPLPRRAVRALARMGPQLRQLEKDLERLEAVLDAETRAVRQATDALDEEVRRVRMLPFAEACQGLQRLVHDLARAGGKEAELIIDGGTVELDRSVLEALKDPLRHLVRNAVDHGIAPASDRRAAAKPAKGRITVAAVLRGAQVEVSVTDDGRGLDLEALRGQAARRQLAEPTDDHEVARLVFLPGLSTAALLTDVSGRGMGLDVVKSRVEALHGSVDVSFTPGRRTRFTLAVPLTLTMLRALLVEAGGQTFAFVATNVQKLLRMDPGQLRSVEGRTMLALGGAPLPVASLAETLGLKAAVPARAAGKPPAVIVAADEKQVVFQVDELLAEQEIVIKNLGARIRRLPHISGATILPSGRIALVLNAANLVRSALGRAALQPAAIRTTPETVARKRVLLVEDSVTTRTLEKSILEAAGYEVMAAADGAIGWQLLNERGADLIVSDIEMPRMDGFALTEAVRGSKRFRDLPVVLVTARASDADRARGGQVGADAYLVKSAFDQRSLLESIAQLL
jgi:two-component system chemotaxis sensor kinase CheA